jgi:hypothetical protein
MAGLRREAGHFAFPGIGSGTAGNCAKCAATWADPSVAVSQPRPFPATLETMPVWSKASRASTEKKAVVSVGQVDSEGSEELRKWLSGLKPVTGADTMLRFTKTPEGSIDLTHAHPSGLAQLMAGRRTRLSTLIRDQQQYVVAARACRNLRSKIFELANDRGIEAGYFSAGTVVWTSAVGGKPQRVSAPVMLTAMSLTIRPGEDDYELQLTEQARINPALIRHLKTIHGIVFDVNAVTRMAYSTARFDPLPVLDRISTLVKPIHGADVEHNLLVSTFADLSGNLDDPWINGQNALVASLAKTASGEIVDVPALQAGRFPSVDERDPAGELLLLDADADQQYVIDAVRAGDSLVVSSPPGTGQTQTAINTIGALVDEGKPSWWWGTGVPASTKWPDASKTWAWTPSFSSCPETQRRSSSRASWCAPSCATRRPRNRGSGACTRLSPSTAMRFWTTSRRCTMCGSGGAARRTRPCSRSRS